MTDLERALADIAEVRERLAWTQRFRGYSGIAAIFSGCLAIAAGIVQALLVPDPAHTAGGRTYFAIWFLCAVAAALVNYAAIAHWFVNDATARDRWQTRTVGLAILPALALGAVLSFALLEDGLLRLLPGVWYGCYGVGLLASQAMLPRGVRPIAAAFLVTGALLLFAPASLALAWWVPPLGFGIGQILIGAAILHERTEHR
jgi:hypothetical protein